jgi:hypothetical protein
MDNFYGEFGDCFKMLGFAAQPTMGAWVAWC